jgi:hypothetical protein
MKCPKNTHARADFNSITAMQQSQFADRMWSKKRKKTKKKEKTADSNNQF